MDLTLDNLLKFAKSDKPDDRFMKLEKDGVVYIYEAECDGRDAKQTGKADLQGLVVNDTFYSTSYYCCHIGKLFRNEVRNFEDMYNKAYAQYISQYTINNLAPVTANTAKLDHGTIETYLREYKQESLYRDTIRKIFSEIDNDSRSYYREDNTEEFAPIFIKYLTGGKDFLTEYIRKQAEIDAETINLNIFKEAERDKLKQELMNDSDFMKRLDIYKIIKENAGDTVRVTLDIDGTILDKLKINTEDLCRALRYNKGEISDSFFSANDRINIQNAYKTRKSYERNVTVDNMISLTYGKKKIWQSP